MKENRRTRTTVKIKAELRSAFVLLENQAENEGMGREGLKRRGGGKGPG